MKKHCQTLKQFKMSKDLKKIKAIGKTMDSFQNSILAIIELKNKKFEFDGNDVFEQLNNMFKSQKFNPND